MLNSSDGRCHRRNSSLVNRWRSLSKTKSWKTVPSTPLFKMITPRFRLSQNENAVIVIIHAPFSRVSDAEIFMDKQDFRFHSKPYFLRLHVPGEIVENDEAKAHFDAETNEYVITCSKVNKGEHFQGLDLITNLLQPKGKHGITQPCIESSGVDETSDSETEFDWFVEQNIKESVPFKGSPYGFAQRHSGLFSTLAEELHQVLDVKNPDDCSLTDRRTQRLAAEQTDFNPEHYLADYFQTEAIIPLLEYKVIHREETDWTESEIEMLKGFPNKDFLLNPEEQKSVYLGLIDILLAYSYDTRITMSDPTVESAWAISKLSGTLSWLEVFTSMTDVVQCFLRRSLCYPLHRNFKLSKLVIEDTQKMLRVGKVLVLKQLLKIVRLFNKSEPRYLLNQLYMQDYCVWIQKASDETLCSLASALGEVKISKDDVDLMLPDLEQAGMNLMCENDSDSDLEDHFSELSIKQKGSGLPMDLLVAAKAACPSSSSSSELDSDDLSEKEESEED